jgi:hypothetical protein
LLFEGYKNEEGMLRYSELSDRPLQEIFAVKHCFLKKYSPRGQNNGVNAIIAAEVG